MRVPAICFELEGCGEVRQRSGRVGGRFREATGITPGEWLINTRIDAARELLEQTRASIDEISAAAGFGSVEALRHHFRRRFGISPATYRRSYLPGAPPMRADA